MLRTSHLLLGTVLVGLITVLVTGCGRSENPAETKVARSELSIGAPAFEPVAAVTASAKSDDEHGHAAGAHGGIIVSIGGDNYHAEAVFEKGGLLRLFTLGNDESKVQEIEAQSLTAYVKAAGAAEAVAFQLEPQTQPGDSAHHTSQFVGKLPKELVGLALEVTIPSVRIAGDRYRVGFQSVTEQHDTEMPDKVADEEERELYLTPGGLYTQADIEANGNLTASEKFVEFVSAHDLHPKPGDRICPVTLTKANPECTWIIGGQEYQFCCPPCVDEFLQLAKTKPEAVQAPDSYVK